jgi:hypothetical protein
MKTLNAALFGGRYILAGICSTAFIMGVLILAYGILVMMGIVFYGDMGGPLNFILIPVLSLALGLAEKRQRVH